jgi:AcrR family transcriptional regulator
MSVDDIVDAAGVAKGTFYVHFASRGDYLATLHRRFHEELDHLIRDASTGLPPGARRLAAATTAYLDGCLGRILVTDEVTARNARNAAAAAESFRALGWRWPESAGRLYVAMAAEAALAELEAGQALPEVRETLRAFVEGR